MKLKRSILILLWLGWGFFASGQSNGMMEIIPENPGEALTLEIGHLYTSAIITGYEGTTLQVELYKGNGRSRMANPPVTYTENNNTITLSHGLITTKNLMYKIKVPRNTSLILEGSLASKFEVNNLEGAVTINTSHADIKVDNLVGDLDARTFKGDIIVTNLTGSPLLHTNDGDIELNFTELPETLPNMVSSMYGNVSLYLAATDKVSLRFRMTFNFEKIQTDFQLQMLNPKSFPMGATGGSDYYRAINGGGTPIYIRQFKGSVKILDAQKLK